MTSSRNEYEEHADANAEATEPALKSERQQYEEHQDKIMTDLAGLKAKGKRIIAADVVAGLVPTEDNSHVRKWAKKELGVSTADFDREMRKLGITEKAGDEIHNARQLVASCIQKWEIEFRFNGAIVSPTYDSDAADDVERDVRIYRDDLGLAQIKNDSIRDVFNLTVKQAAKTRLEILIQEVSAPLTDDELAAAEKMWLGLAGPVFKDANPAFVAAVLKTFMWQVKRKMLGLPVYRHLMPVLLGLTERGKSTFVELMTNPLAELRRPLTFKQLEDDRIIQMWSSFIGVLDEMDHADKSNVETIKNVITAATVSRRPMYSNHMMEKKQNLTLIGTSNKELNQSIKDTTSARRFIGLDWENEPNFGFINCIGWLTMWRSVDANGPHPMEPFRAELARRQGLVRQRSRVEGWLESALGAFLADGARRTKSQLFLLFAAHEDQLVRSSFKTSEDEWHKEMVRLTKCYGDDKAPFEWKRGTGGRYIYVFRKDRHAKILKAANDIADDFMPDDDDDPDFAAFPPAMTIFDGEVFDAIQHTTAPRDTASIFASPSTAEVPAIKTMIANIMNKSRAGDITDNMDRSLAGDSLAAAIARQRAAPSGA